MTDEYSMTHEYSMNIKLLTEEHLEFLSLKRGTQACLSLHLSKCHIVGNHMSRLNYIYSSGLVQYMEERTC